MDKPYNSDIIKAMAAHSDACAAYASAMKWDWLRHQKVGDVTRDNLVDDCGFCERRGKGEDCRDVNCRLYKLQNSTICNNDATFWGKAHNALKAKDQQSFTQNANDLYFQIRSIIDNFYKPEPEKEEVFYRIGQEFVWDKENDGWILVAVESHKVRFINKNTGGHTNLAPSVSVGNATKITEKELGQICNGQDFTLIADKK